MGRKGIDANLCRRRTEKSKSGMMESAMASKMSDDELAVILGESKWDVSEETS